MKIIINDCQKTEIGKMRNVFYFAIQHTSLFKNGMIQIHIEIYFIYRNSLFNEKILNM